MYITNTLEEIELNNEKLREAIISELRSMYDENDLDILVDYLLKIVTYPTEREELSGIEERQYAALEKIFDEETSLSEIRLCIGNVLKIEPTLKKVLSLIDVRAYEEIQNERLGLANVIKKLGMNPNNKKLDARPESYSKDCDYMEHIARAYSLRNSEAHLFESWNRKDIFINLDSVLITWIRAIKINEKKIVDFLESNVTLSEIAIESYLKKVTGEFKERMKRFIHLRGEENLELIGGLAIEQANERDNDKGTLRRGTVDNLRKTSVPEHRMILWGEAGIGKSTTLEYLAYTDAQTRLKDKNANIPILFLLGIMLDGNCSIKQYICDKLKVDMQECDKLLSAGKINLFLDGLNEIPTGGVVSNLKTIRMREIRQLMVSYPKTFIIITNRPQDSRDFDNIPVFNLQKLNDDEIKLFLEKNVSTDSVKQNILDSLSNDKNFRKVIRTPLILSRLVATVQYTNIVPKSEGAIIGQFLKCLFEREKNEKLDERLDIQKMTYLLRVIAFESLENKEANAGMIEAELIGYCSKCMKLYKFEYDAFYAIKMMVQLGILERRENVYVFSHQSYQDYYYGLEELAVLQS